MTARALLLNLLLAAKRLHWSLIVHLQFLSLTWSEQVMTEQPGDAERRGVWLFPWSFKAFLVGFGWKASVQTWGGGSSHRMVMT